MSNMYDVTVARVDLPGRPRIIYATVVGAIDVNDALEKLVASRKTPQKCCGVESAEISEASIDPNHAPSGSGVTLSKWLEGYRG